MRGINDEAAIARIHAVLPMLNEAQRRMYLAAEAEAIGAGGITWVSDAAGVSRVTITAGRKDLREGRNLCVPGESGTPIRREGGGRKPLETAQPGIGEALESLIDPCADHPLRWTTKSTRKLCGELRQQGFQAGERSVASLLKKLGYRLSQTRSTGPAGSPCPDRAGQFRLINDLSAQFLRGGCPVICVDCERVQPAGQDSAPDCDPPSPDPEQSGFAEAGSPDSVHPDAAVFAVSAIRSWWNDMGSTRYPGTDRLLITVAGGGLLWMASPRWKSELQKFAEETRLDLTVCQLPPGTSRWIGVEYRLCNRITTQWPVRPPESLRITVELIASAAAQPDPAPGCEPGQAEPASLAHSGAPGWVDRIQAGGTRNRTE